MAGLVQRMIGAVTGRSRNRDGFDALGAGEPDVYPALSGSCKIPHYRNPSPMELIPHQKKLRSIIRHLDRTDHHVHVTLETKVEVVVGTGPRPHSRFKELNELFMASSGRLDNRGDRSWMQFVEDLARNLFLDGEVFVRVRDRQDRPAWSNVQVPIQFQILSCDMVPDDYEGPYNANVRFRSGVAIQNDRRLGFAVWTEHPVDGWQMGRMPKLVMLPPTELFQIYRTSLGNVRGEVPMASAIVPAEDLADLVELDIQHRKNSASQATYFEQVGDNREQGGGPGVVDPDRSTMERVVRNLHMRPGDHLLLPPGYKANVSTPTGGAPGHELSVKTLTMAICSVAGVLYFDAHGDWKEAPERAMRYAGASMKRKVVRERAMIEHQGLNPLWRAFVAKAMTSGMWTPPAGATVDEIFGLEWRWPIVQQAALDRELNVMLQLVQAGVVPPSQITEDYFGWDLETGARRWAEDAARMKTLGIKTLDAHWGADSAIAKRILAAVEVEEGYERDLVDQSALDESVLRRPGSG